MAPHQAKFSWPNTHPNAVVITGSFDNWSGNTHHLTKTESGFEGEIPLEWGRDYEYKYVVDGNWQIRDDQDKEWDSAGNVNNRYRAPSEPISAPVIASAPIVAAESSQPASTHTPAEANGLLSTRTPGPAASISAVKDEELTSSPSHEAGAATPAEPYPADETPAQAIKKEAEAADVAAAQAETPKPIKKALEPITPDEDEAGASATIAGAVAAVTAGVGGLVAGAQHYWAGDTLESASEDQTKSLEKVDSNDIHIPTPTSTATPEEEPISAAPTSSYSLGAPINSAETVKRDEGIAVPSDASEAVVDDASITSHPDNFEVVPTPTKLADEPAVVVPKHSEEKFEHVSKEEAPASTASPTTIPAAAAVEAASIPSAVPVPAPSASSEAPVPVSSVAPVASTNAATVVPRPALKDAAGAAPTPSSASDSDIHPAAAATAAATTAPDLSASAGSTVTGPTLSSSGATPAAAAAAAESPSTPVKDKAVVPGSYPDSIPGSGADAGSGPASLSAASTPAKASPAKKTSAEDDKLRKRKSSFFASVGKIFGKKDKEGK